MRTRFPIRQAAVAAAVIALVAVCATREPARLVDRAPRPAPKAEPASPAPPKPVAKPIPTHTIKRGETLVGIALQYGLDYRELERDHDHRRPLRCRPPLGRIASQAGRAQEQEPAQTRSHDDPG